jgi:hypothetical protein
MKVLLATNTCIAYLTRQFSRIPGLPLEDWVS